MLLLLRQGASALGGCLGRIQDIGVLAHCFRILDGVHDVPHVLDGLLDKVTVGREDRQALCINKSNVGYGGRRMK